jgi:hypothetical protein
MRSLVQPQYPSVKPHATATAPTAADRGSDESEREREIPHRRSESVSRAGSGSEASSGAQGPRLLYCDDINLG